MPVTPLEPNDPQRLGDYVLSGRLGAGGMGVVYFATAPDGALVAVKLVRADLAHDLTFRERFRREVEALRRISGPRVARLLAADTEALQPYLVVEYVDGPTLAESVAASGPVAGNRLRALAAALAEAIVVIHEAGVIHRDLKPSNVILAADQPKLVDFGIAAAAGSVPLTMAGTVIGSAGWMAPEQAAGQVSTPAVDVFTWASLVTYAGTGRPPFGTGSPEAVTSRILNGAPDLDGLPQEVRPFVEAAFLRDPARRPSARAVLEGIVGREGASTDQLVEETTHLIENTWVMPAGGWPAPPGPPLSTAPPPSVAAPRRRPVWPVALVVGLVCLLGGIAVALVLADRGGDATATDPVTGGVDTTAPPTTLPPTTVPTTTTTEPLPPPIDVTVQMTIGRNDLLDFLDQIFGSPVPDTGSDCAEPATLVSLEDGEGHQVVPPTAFPAGESVQGGILEDCRYELAFPGVAGADQYLVVVSDEADLELGRADLSASELEASQGVIDLNELFDVNSLFDTP